MQFGRIHGIALAILGALLLAFQTMLFFTTPQRVIPGATESSTPKVERKTNPVPGILGVAPLAVGMVIFVTRRRADEPEAKNAVQ
ncbi:MAG TPA: hypothetical protein VN025_05740 [Candidatus Dormibacteraeota bacterium]|jgi:hypothetical protein|nr:hypothetical protein [Candidatus Dormibacteraeota bacterium]